jgi:uncharacterized OB-fold protein
LSAAGPDAAYARQLPLIDGETGFFWTGGAQGRLLIQRCADCGRYQHPPLPRCACCHGEAVGPVPVSGRGTVKSFTVNHQQWLAGMKVPFVFAAVELVEQPELYVFSNLLGPIDEMRIGMKMRVCFERHDDVWLPMFESDESADG